MTDEQIIKFLELLDRHVRNRTGYGYGLPLFEPGEIEQMIKLVKEWLNV